jgi:hypothetical protein
MISFFEIKQLLVKETKRYKHQYLEMLDEGNAPLPEATIWET